MGTITTKEGTKIYYKDWGSKANPEGLPIEVFDGFRAAFLTGRSQFFLDLAGDPFFGFNRPGVKVSQGLINS